MSEVRFNTTTGHTAVLSIDPERFEGMAHQFYVELSPAEELKQRMAISQHLQTIEKSVERLEKRLDSMLPSDQPKSFYEVFSALRNAVICYNDKYILWNPHRSEWSKVNKYLRTQMSLSKNVLDTDVLSWVSSQYGRGDAFGEFYKWSDTMVSDTINRLKLCTPWVGSLTKRRLLMTSVQYIKQMSGDQVRYEFLPMSRDMYLKRWVDYIRSKLEF